MLNKLEWESLESRREQLSLTMLYNMLKQNTYFPFEYIPQFHQQTSLRTRQCHPFRLTEVFCNTDTFKYSLCVSFKKDLDKHPPLFVDSLSIAEVNVLRILGIYFDRKLTWSSMINQLAARSRQRLGAVFRARNYLGQSGLTVAFK